MTRPLASIIINNYNYGRFLRRSIESAIAQTYPATEVIVVDDGSTDDSREVISGFGDQIIPILKPNGGHASALNAGFARSQGGIVVFLDSDDELHPTAVETVQPLLADRSVVKVHWHQLVIDENDALTGALMPPDDVLPEGDLRAHMIAWGPGSIGWPPTSGNAWSRLFLDEVFPIPEEEYRQAAESHLYVLAPLFGEIKSCKPLGYYRAHGTNHSTSLGRNEYLEFHVNLVERQMEFVASHLRRCGIRPDIRLWREHSWYHRLHESARQIDDIVPDGGSLVLIDDHNLMTSLNRSHEAIYVFDRMWKYWDDPNFGQRLMREIERSRNAGASHLVVSWTMFWLLEHVPRLAERLRSAYPCILDNDRILVFELAGGEWAGS